MQPQYTPVLPKQMLKQQEAKIKTLMGPKSKVADKKVKFSPAKKDRRGIHREWNLLKLFPFGTFFFQKVKQTA